MRNERYIYVNRVEEEEEAKYAKIYLKRQKRRDEVENQHTHTHSPPTAMKIIILNISRSTFSWPAFSWLLKLHARCFVLFSSFSFKFIALFYSCRLRVRRVAHGQWQSMINNNCSNTFGVRISQKFLPKLVYVIEPPFMLSMPDDVGGDVVMAGLTTIDGPVVVYSTVVCCCCICSFWRKLFNATSKPRA